MAQERVDFLKTKLQSKDNNNTEQQTTSEEGEIVATINGAKLEFTQCIHPLFGRQSPLILSSHVTTTAGTGLVHTAPGMLFNRVKIIILLNLKHFIKAMVRKILL